jgi:hypothetical protein
MFFNGTDDGMEGSLNGGGIKNDWRLGRQSRGYYSTDVLFSQGKNGNWRWAGWGVPESSLQLARPKPNIPSRCRAASRPPGDLSHPHLLAPSPQKSVYFTYLTTQGRHPLTAPDSILKLVDQFHTHLSTYKSQTYNETQARREFIDPFFEALGWDVFNKQSYAHAYKDVIHEDAIKVAGKSRAPDYAFRIGGTRKFFVEAKKPAVNLRDEISPAYQLRRYAWSAKLPLSILTDFEEFSVYDCRIKPSLSDKPSVGRIMMLTYNDYPQQWDEIYSIFSKDAVWKGSFDKYAESSTGKRGTTEVDHAFLAEIERWRDLLARNIALRNPSLSQHDLNYAVQMTIDRLIFLRICEDRGIEFYGQLQSLLNGGDVYPRLCQHFQKADERYNSGLFHFHAEKGQAETPDGLTLGLTLDDKPLKDILSNLYYPESPYEFSVLPADILGQVYEQFLGKVIRLTTGHRAVVEDKPEVKKAGGVFYTPTYIVEYIVKNTLGRLLEGKHPGDMGVGHGAPIRVLDMACGSGSFLIVAYQTLLDWYLNEYSLQEAEKWAKGRNPRLARSSTGDWRLTTAERKRILLDHIYGVDIDPQAVEVTKLSLLLKVLDEESEDKVGHQLSMFHERALPDLGQNIKCGNSLIGNDFYSGQQASFLDDEEQRRINAFDWDREFPHVFASSGGFDVVVGNPPYIRQEGLGNDKEYYNKNYTSFCSTADIYVNFIEKGIKLLRSDGRFGMIVSNKWLRAAYGKGLREFLVNSAFLEQIVDFAGLPVFSNATVRTIIMICKPADGQVSEGFKYLAPLSIQQFRMIRTGIDLTDLFNQYHTLLEFPKSELNGWALSSHNSSQLIQHLHQESLSLKSYIKRKPYFGIKTGYNKAFVIGQATRDMLIAKDPRSSEIIRPMIVGRDIRRYTYEFRERYLIWAYIGVPIKDYPAIYQHLKAFEPQLQKRWDKGNYWWELRACDYYDQFSQPKIIYPDIATECRFVLDKEGYFSTNTTYFIPGNNLFLLGILNSKLAYFYFTTVCAGLEGGGKTYLRFFGQYLERFPVVNVSPDSSKVLMLSSLVDRILTLHRDLAAAQTPGEHTRLQRQVDGTDAQIDALVYELYGLTEEEIKIVEGNG